MGLSVPLFDDLLLLSLFPALTCSGVSVSIWISVHSIDDDIEINSVLGSSPVANCVSGSSLKVAGIFAGTIWTWQTTFLVIMFCSSTLLMDIELPTFPAIVLVRALVERRQSCSKSFWVRLVSILLAAGFCGDGVFRIWSESDD